MTYFTPFVLPCVGVCHQFCTMTIWTSACSNTCPTTRLMCISVVVVIIIVGIVIGTAIINRYRIIIGSTSIVGRIGSIGVKRLAGIG